MRLILLAAAAAALSTAQQTPPVVRAHGEAIVTVTPDEVSIQIGVITQAQTAQAAGSANAKQAAEVIAEMKKIAGAGSEVRTVHYGVTPNYKYAREGGNPTITGYTATNIVQVTTRDTSAAGRIIDAAAKTGANTIQGIQFSLHDEQPARAQALREATRQARASAEAMAAALGMKVTRVTRIEDSPEHEPRPIMREFAQRGVMAADAVTATPVEAGTIRVRASVALTAEAGP